MKAKKAVQKAQKTKPKPIETCKNSSCDCVYMLVNTIKQHLIVLIITSQIRYDISAVRLSVEEKSIR